MSITIGSNIASLKAQRQLETGTNTLGKVFERLASGQRINRASDDAAGLAIATSLQAESRVFTKAFANANDGISLLSIAEGALQQLSGLVTRQLELAEQAANGVYSSKQRQALQLESNQLTAEYNRIVQSTSFNGIQLIDGSNSAITLQHGMGEAQTTKISLGSVMGRGAGTGTFSLAVSTAVAATPYGATAADLNYDGYADVALYGGFGTINVLLNNGDGTMKTTTLAAPNAVVNDYRVSAADMNGDGFRDLVLTSQGNALTYLNNGDGTFAAGITSNFFSTSSSEMALADINGDNKTDLVFASRVPNALYVAYGRGDGTFNTGVSSFYAESNTSGLKLADINNDGRLDVVELNTSNNSVTTRFGLAGGGFGNTGSNAFFSGGLPGLSLELIDVNSDGKLDAVVGGPGYVVIGLGDGAGSFSASVSLALGTVGGTSLGIGDFNDDGKVDILAGINNAAYTTMFLGNADGTFLAPQTFTTGSAYIQLLVADFSGDGLADIFRSGNNSYSLMTANPSSSRFINTIENLDLSTAPDSRASLAKLSRRFEKISQELSIIGASVSRIEAQMQNIQSYRINIEAAASRITDADIAAESSELVRRQILQQAGASVLAQANQQPRLALELLRG